MYTLAELRRNQSLSQRQLAEKLKMSSGAIALYETGERTPPLKKARLIASYFGVSLDDIFFASNANDTTANES